MIVCCPSRCPSRRHLQRGLMQPGLSVSQEDSRQTSWLTQKSTLALSLAVMYYWLAEMAVPVVWSAAAAALVAMVALAMEMTELVGGEALAEEIYMVAMESVEG